MEFVGAYEVSDRAQTIHFVAQIGGQFDWRPYPEIPIRELNDDRTRRIGKAKEGDNLALCDPKSVMHLIEHVVTPEIADATVMAESLKRKT
jgi:hypothetical protein